MHEKPRLESAEAILEALRRLDAELRRRFGVRSLGLFGSWARGAARQDSDIDLVVELERQAFDDYMGLKFYLEDHFQRPVDLVLKSEIKPRLRERILREVRYAG